MPDVTKRFSNRVADYVKYRPNYPASLIDYLFERTGLCPGAEIADIGSGTGIFTGQLLGRGMTVYAVEPNDEMRAAAEALLRSHERFRSVSGSAESTGLPDTCADLIVVAQAFHWFDASAARAEFARIGRPGAFTALIWNDRKVDTTPFLVAYERLLHELGTDYTEVNHRNVGDERLRAFYAGDYEAKTFPNEQQFDWEGLYGRAMSSSYVPGEGDPGHAAFVRGLRAIFDEYAVNGRVAFHYDSRLYLGRA